MFHRSLLALSLTLLIASAASAETVFITPVLEPPTTGNFRCLVLNGHTTKTIEFVRQIFDFQGNVLENPQAVHETLPPLHYTATDTSDDLARYCIVTLLSGSKTKVRVTISITTSSGTTIATLEGHP
jgi:hypothetical protein